MKPTTPRSRAHRPRHPWCFERLEDRTLLSARTLAIGRDGTATASGVLTAIGQVDLYDFVAPSTGLYGVEELAPAGSDLDTSVTVSDARGNELASDTGDGPGQGNGQMTDSIVRVDLVAGQAYQIGASGDISNTVNTGEYVLQVTPYSRAIPLVAGLDGRATASSAINQDGMIDDYRYIPQTSGLFDVAEGATSDSTLSPLLTVVDAQGNVLGTDFDFSGADGNSPLDASVVVSLVAHQTYYLEASGDLGSDTGGIDVSITPFAAATPPTFPSGVATLSGDVARDGSLGLFRFRAPSTGLIAVRREASSADPLDSTLTIYDGLGAALAQDDSPDATNSLARFTASAGQTYYVEALLSTDQTTGTYTFQVSPDDFGDSTDEATDVPLVANRVATQAGTIEVSGDTDAFGFVASQTGPLVVQVDPGPGSGLDPSLSAQDIQGNTEPQDDDTQVVIQAVAGQTYYALVSSADGSTGGYVLSLTPPDFGSSFATATPLTITGSPTSQAGALLQAGEANFFTFKAPTTGTIRAELDGTPGGFIPQITAFDGSDAPIAVGGPAVVDGDPASRLKFAVDAGRTYRIEVASTGTSASTGPYTLKLVSQRAGGRAARLAGRAPTRSSPGPLPRASPRPAGWTSSGSTRPRPACSRCKPPPNPPRPVSSCSTPRAIPSLKAIPRRRPTAAGRRSTSTSSRGPITSR